MRENKIFILFLVGILVFSNLIIVEFATADDPIEGPPKNLDPAMPDYPSWYLQEWWSNFCDENTFSKKVWDQDTGTWVEYTTIEQYDTIKFKLSFTAQDTELEDVILVDYLPATVKYISASESPVSNVKEIFFDYNYHNYPGESEFFPFTKLTWDIGTVQPLSLIHI